MSIRHSPPSGGVVNQDDYLAAHLLDGTPGMILGADGSEIDPASLSVSSVGDGLASLFTTISSIPETVTAFETSGYSTAGVGGGRYIYDASVDAAYVAARPRAAKMIGARGFRLDPSQRLDIQMFGAVAGGTMAANGANNLAAILAAIALQPIAGRTAAPTLHWPMGDFYCSATVNVHAVVHWKGESNGNNYGGFFVKPTRLITPINTTTIINHNSNTVEAGTGAIGSAFGSIYEGISFEQQGLGNSATAYGFWMRGSATLIDCTVHNIASHGIYMNCTAGIGGLLEGDCNNWTITRCFAHDIGGDALHIQGQDTNAGVSTLFVTAGNTIGGCGIYDAAGIHNTHLAPQITGYGDKGAHHAGHKWQLIDPNPGIGAATEPGTNSNIWYDLGAGATVAGRFDAWSGASIYKLALPIFIQGSSRVYGGYQEFGTTICHALSGVIDGPFACTVFTNASGIVNGAKTHTAGIGAYRSANGNTTDAYYGKMGAYAFTLTGTRNPYDSTDRPNIAETRVEQDGEVSLYTYWQGKDIVHAYLNSKPIYSYGGLATARTYGRSTAQPHIFTLHDYALQSPEDGNDRRIHGIRPAAPTTGNHAQGEFIWNIAPNAGGILGWVCTTSGTPGTWKAVGGVAA